MLFAKLRQKWRARRLELAMGQIGNPADRLDDDGMTNPTPMDVRATRAELSALSRMGRAKSKTDWRGD